MSTVSIYLGDIDNLCHFEMSEKVKEQKMKLKQLKEKVAENKKLIQNLTLSKQKKLACVTCTSKNINLIYCTSCGTQPVCNTHFRNIPRSRKYPLCNQSTISRRWSMPVPK